MTIRYIAGTVTDTSVVFAIGGFHQEPAAPCGHRHLGSCLTTGHGDRHRNARDASMPGHSSGPTGAGGARDRRLQGDQPVSAGVR